MTAARLLTIYKPLIAAFGDGFHITQFLEVCSKPGSVIMSELRSPLDRSSRENWVQAGLITYIKIGHCRVIRATPKALRFLRCKSHADVAVLRDHKRSLPPALVRKIKSFTTLLSIAAHGGPVSINEAKDAAHLPHKGTTMTTYRAWQREGWITLDLDPSANCRKWLLTITPLGLQALGVTA